MIHRIRVHVLVTDFRWSHSLNIGIFIKRPLSYFYSRGKTISCKHYLDKPYSWQRLSVEVKRKEPSKKYTDLILFSVASSFSFSTNMFLFFLQKIRIHKKCLLNYPQCAWTWHFTHTPPILFDTPSHYLDTLLVYNANNIVRARRFC